STAFPLVASLIAEHFRAGARRRASNNMAMAATNMAMPTTQQEPTTVSITPSAQYRLTIRVRMDDTQGVVGQVTSAIGDAGGMVGAIDLVEADARGSGRDIVVDAANREHWGRILEAIDALAGVEVVDTTDRTFLLHMG